MPEHLRQQILTGAHSSPYSGHFSGQRLYNTLTTRWWWEGMFSDAKKFAKSCSECAIVMGSGRVNRPPLHPIPVSRPFQILGIDVMDLPVTDQGNKHVVVIQDLFTKWPMLYRPRPKNSPYLQANSGGSNSVVWSSGVPAF